MYLLEWGDTFKNVCKWKIKSVFIGLKKAGFCHYFEHSNFSVMTVFNDQCSTFLKWVLRHLEWDELWIIALQVWLKLKPKLPGF